MNNFNYFFIKTFKFRTRFRTSYVLKSDACLCVQQSTPIKYKRKILNLLIKTLFLIIVNYSHYPFINTETLLKCSFYSNLYQS